MPTNDISFRPRWHIASRHRAFNIFWKTSRLNLKGYKMWHRASYSPQDQEDALSNHWTQTGNSVGEKDDYINPVAGVWYKQRKQPMNKCMHRKQCGHLLYRKLNKERVREDLCWRNSESFTKACLKQDFGPYTTGILQDKWMEIISTKKTKPTKQSSKKGANMWEKDHIFWKNKNKKTPHLNRGFLLNNCRILRSAG